MIVRAFLGIKIVPWYVRYAERLNVILKIRPGHGRSIYTAVLFMRMSCTAAAKTDRIAAARAMLLLRLQPFQRQFQGIGDLRFAVRSAKTDGNEVPDEEVAHGTVAARERK